MTAARLQADVNVGVGPPSQVGRWTFDVNVGVGDPSQAGSWTFDVNVGVGDPSQVGRWTFDVNVLTAPPPARLQADVNVGIGDARLQADTFVVLVSDAFLQADVNVLSVPTLPPAVFSPVRQNRLLDLDRGIAQVGATFRWDLINHGLGRRGVIGQVHPELGATMSNDTNSTLFRTVTGFRLPQSEWSQINVLTDWVMPWMILSDGTQWPLGVLAFASNPVTEGSNQSWMESTLVDLRSILDNPLGWPFGISNGRDVFEFERYLIEQYGITDYEIIDTGTRVGGGPIAFPPDATGLTILETLALLARCHKPYFDNYGKLIIRPPTTFGLGFGHIYDRANGRIKERTLVATSNLLTAPNAFKVISSSGGGKDVSGIYYIDPTLPHSRENRGFEVYKVLRIPGLADPYNCVVAAAHYAGEDSGQYATKELTSVPDPRHDTFDVVEIDGVPWREVAWSMTMSPGGDHSHRLVQDLTFREL